MPVKGNLIFMLSTYQLAYPYTNMQTYISHMNVSIHSEYIISESI